MLVGTFEHKAATRAQADSRGIATNVAISDLVSRSITTSHCHYFALSQEIMQRIIAQKSTFCENKALPCEAGPPLVHDLCLCLWNKVEHLGTHDLKEIALPGLEMGGVTHQEEQDVFFWLFGELWWFAWSLITILLGLFCFFIEAPEIIILACHLCGFLFFLPGRFITTQQQIIVHVLLDRECRIQETLDLGLAVIELVLRDALGVNACLVDHTT